MSTQQEKVELKVPGVKLSKAEFGSKKQEIPVNWPTDLVYLESLVWPNISEETKGKYYLPEDNDSTASWLEVCVDVDTQELFVTSRAAQVAGVWLGEYTGVVKQAKEVSDTTFSVGYFWDKKGVFYIDASEQGNETRFIRRETKDRPANIRFQPLWVDGRLGVFVEIIKDIQANEEVVAEFEEAAFGITSKRAVMNSESSNYTYTQTLTITDGRFYKRSLMELCDVKLVNDPKHPCNGQLGLFAGRALKKDYYLGEYTGVVIDQMVESVYSSKYLVDYSNPGIDGLEMVVADAAVEGNEMRFINDFRNTGKEVNIVMKRMWVAGMLRPFVQLTSDVKEGEEFFADYGDRYWENVKL